MHNESYAHSHTNGAHSDSFRSNNIIDSFSIDAGHEQSKASEADGACEHHSLGSFGEGEAVDPPLDEEQFQEGDEERVHHADSEDDGVGVFHGGLHDCRVLDAGRQPLSQLRCTQMAREPRVRAVEVRIMFLTLIAPML